MLSMPGMSVRFYFKRRRAVSLFKKELISNGLTNLEAEWLAEVYPFKLSEMLKMLRVREKFSQPKDLLA